MGGYLFRGISETSSGPLQEIYHSTISACRHFKATSLRKTSNFYSRPLFPPSASQHVDLLSLNWSQDDVPWITELKHQAKTSVGILGLRSNMLGTSIIKTGDHEMLSENISHVLDGLSWEDFHLQCFFNLVLESMAFLEGIEARAGLWVTNSLMRFRFLASFLAFQAWFADGLV